MESLLIFLALLLYVAGVVAAIVTVWCYEAENFNGPSLVVIPAIVAFALLWPAMVAVQLLVEFAERRRA